MKPLTRNLTLTLAAALFAIATTHASAAVVTAWGSAVAINSNDDIVNAAHVVHAVNFGNAVSNINVAVGGETVTFDPTGVVGGTGFSNADFFVDNNPAAGTVGSDFESVLDSFRDNSNSSYTFTGLSEGVYTLQVFQSDDRGNRSDVTWDVDGTAVVFDSDTTVFRSAYVIAIVTLGAGETDFTLTRTNRQINAAVLTQVVVPTPAALPAGIAMLGLVTLRRRAHNR